MQFTCRIRRATGVLGRVCSLAETLGESVFTHKHFIHKALISWRHSNVRFVPISGHRAISFDHVVRKCEHAWRGTAR